MNDNFCFPSPKPTSNPWSIRVATMLRTRVKMIGNFTNKNIINYIHFIFTIPDNFLSFKQPPVSLNNITRKAHPIRAIAGLGA